MKAKDVQKATISEQTKLFLEVVVKLRDVQSSMYDALREMYSGDETVSSLINERFTEPYDKLEEAVNWYFMNSVHRNLDFINETEI